MQNDHDDHLMDREGKTIRIIRTTLRIIISILGLPPYHSPNPTPAGLLNPLLEISILRSGHRGWQHATTHCSIASQDLRREWTKFSDVFPALSALVKWWYPQSPGDKLVDLSFWNLILFTKDFRHTRGARISAIKYQPPNFPTHLALQSRETESHEAAVGG